VRVDQIRPLNPFFRGRPRRALRAASAAGLIATIAVIAVPGVAASTQTVVRSRAACHHGGCNWILVNNHQLTLYIFSRDSYHNYKPTCYGKCAKVWRPLIAPSGHVVGVAGGKSQFAQIDQRELGTVKRKTGQRQVTYYGQPLYRYIRDTAPGQMKGHFKSQFGGQWDQLTTGGSPLAKSSY
jgi:predicted lipoprotein with Yx(FWY)xxD motif